MFAGKCDNQVTPHYSLNELAGGRGVPMHFNNSAQFVVADKIHSRYVYFEWSYDLKSIQDNSMHLIINTRVLCSESDVYQITWISCKII